MFVRILLPCVVLQFGLTPVFADELPNLSRVIVCKLIKDDAERLRCYDRALSEAPADAPSQVTTAPVGETHVVEDSWHVSEGKSATDGSPQLTAALEAVGGRGALITGRFTRAARHSPGARRRTRHRRVLVSPGP
jgi:hypothetical protein